MSGSRSVYSITTVATSPKALAWIWQEEHETVLSADGFYIK
jgi:hypothetical protein